MIKHPHAIHNDDESIWIDFDGPIPRVGEIINIDGTDIEYKVIEVRWFITPWRIEPFPSPNTETKNISQARVKIGPSEGLSE
jgi:hypothetical protein